MAKITDYPELTLIDPEADYVVIAYNGLNYKVLAGNLSFPAPHHKMIPVISDFINALDFPFAITTPGAISTENNHPGNISPVAIRFMPSSGPQYVFIGGEVSEVVFVQTGLLGARYGLYTEASNLEGITIETTAGGVLTGKTRDGAGAANLSTTPTSYTITAGVWYRVKIMLNVAKTQVDFYLYDVNGNILWSGTLTTNIPTVLDRVTVAEHGFIDWAAVYNTSVLVR